MEFRKELKEIGLTDKQAAVYLACLELGPSPVQPIARKAKVVRATTYVILSGLMKQGLVTKFEQGKKTMFAAEPPLQLKRLLEKQAEEVKNKERLLDAMLPELQVLMRAAGDRPSVRYYEGKEGLHAIRQEINMYCRSGDVIYNLTPADYLIAVFSREEDTFYQQRRSKGIRARTIFTTKSEALRRRWFLEDDPRQPERKFVPPNKFTWTSGITIYRDRIAIGSFAGKLGGVIIESQEMADSMRVLFEMAWLGLAGNLKRA